MGYVGRRSETSHRDHYEQQEQRRCPILTSRSALAASPADSRSSSLLASVCSWWRRTSRCTTSAIPFTTVTDLDGRGAALLSSVRAQSCALSWIPLKRASVRFLIRPCSYAARSLVD